MGVPALEGSDEHKVTQLQVLQRSRSAPPELRESDDIRPSLILWAVLPILVITAFQIVFVLPTFRRLEAEFQDNLFFVYGVISIVLTLVLIYPFKFVIVRAYLALKKGRLEWDHLKVLILISGVVSVFVQTAMHFGAFCREGIYYSIPLVFSILLVDSVLDAICFENLKRLCGFRFHGIGTKVRLLKKSTEKSIDLGSEGKRVSAESLQRNDEFLIGPHEIIPVDGEIVEGVVEVEERKYSAFGERYFKGRGQTLFAGSKIIKGDAKVQVLNVLGDSHLETTSERLNRSVNESGNWSWYSSLEKGSQIAIIFLSACVPLYWQDRGAAFPFLINGMISILLISGLSKVLKCLPRLTGLALTEAFFLGALLKDSSVLGKLRKVQTIVIDYSYKYPPGEMSVTSFDLVDDRIDEDKIISALFSFLGRSSEKFPRAAVRYLRSRMKEKDPSLFEVLNYQEYPEKGVLGTIEGVDFSVGSEDYLLERGVQMDVSLLSEIGEGEGVVYVAVGEEIVGRFRVAPPFRNEARSWIQDLTDNRNVRVVLCSMDGSGIVDLAGKNVGLELGRIFGGLSEEAYLEKIKSFDSVIYYSPSDVSGSIAKEALLRATSFDELHFNLEADVVLFSGTLSVLSLLLRVARLKHKIYYANLIFASILAGFLTLYAFLGLSSPVVVGVSILCFTAFLYLGVSRLTSYPMRLEGAGAI